ncbi:MAG: MBL fold metallo-hydrolase [Bryobacterales bacterium]
MSRLRSVYLAVALLLGLPIVLLFGATRWVQAQLPPPQGDRIRGPHGLVGVQTGWSHSSYAWVVPTAHGVVVIDPGADPTGHALVREIGQREVQAVLLTHGHVDRVAGLAALPAEAPVWVDPAELPTLRGEVQPGGWLARIRSATSKPPEIHGEVRALDGLADGTAPLEIDGERFQAVQVPGHSPGELAWLWEDVLFTGDAVVGGSSLTLPPAPLSDDPEQARKSVDKLLPLDFDAVADDHAGLTTAARAALFRLADRPEAPPTVSVATRGDAESADPGEVIRVRGILVRTPTPDVRGEQPELLYTALGQVWRLSDGPVPEHAALDGQAGRGRGGAAVRGPARAGRSPSARSSPTPRGPPTLSRPLSARIGEVVRVTGTVARWRPLSAGAQWGEGSITVATPPAGPADPPPVPLSAPIRLFEAPTSGAEDPPGPVTLDVRVARDTVAGFRLVALSRPRADAPDDRSSTGAARPGTGSPHR